MEQQPQEQQQHNSPIKLTRPLYTVVDITFMLNYKDERSVRSMLKKGVIKGFKINGMWRVTREELQRFLDERFGGQ